MKAHSKSSLFFGSFLLGLAAVDRLRDNTSTTARDDRAGRETSMSHRYKVFSLAACFLFAVPMLHREASLVWYSSNFARAN